MKDTGEFLKEGWDYTVIRDFVPEYVVDHVQENLHPAYLSNKVDKSWWNEISNGKFTVKSVLGTFEKQERQNWKHVKLWIKGIPIKILFIMRTLFGKIFVAFLMHR